MWGDKAMAQTRLLYTSPILYGFYAHVHRESACVYIQELHEHKSVADIGIWKGGFQVGA